MFLAFYFVPKISPERSAAIVAGVTVRNLFIVQGLFLSGALVLYMGKEFFISLIFSSEFNALSELIIYQLVGDFFKIGAYVIGFVAIAKAATKIYIAAEIFQGAVFLLGAWALTRQNVGVESVMQAYVMTYVFYFLVCLIGLKIYARRQA
ncbi:Lipid III flippase [compost metagenome]